MPRKKQLQSVNKNEITFENEVKSNNIVDSKPNTLDNLQQTHGKTEEEPKTQPTTLDQIWGDDGVWKYKTLDVEEYKNWLNDLTSSEIQSHANRLGFVPVGELDVLKKKLIEEFRGHVAKYNAAAIRSQNKEQSTQVSSEVSKILKEGQ
jgi:hypothetical protein